MFLQDLTPFQVAQRPYLPVVYVQLTHMLLAQDLQVVHLVHLGAPHWLGHQHAYALQGKYMDGIAYACIDRHTGILRLALTCQ